MAFHLPGRTLLWRIARLLIASSQKHAFLDRGWIGPLLESTPATWRVPLAMRLLSLSPHYWVYQWTSRYPRSMRRGEVLACEYERNAQSRQELCDKLLAPRLRRDMTVLDFGCGPGFLARAASRHVGRLIATDISRGVIACAKYLNPAPNLQYVVNRSDRLCDVAESSVDLVYTFAVLQHLLKRDAELFLGEFLRVLRPGGQVFCHMILKEPGEPRAADPSAGGWVDRRVNLRMVYFTPAEAVELFRQVGFDDVEVTPVRTMAHIDDDIGQEHVVTGRRAAAVHANRATARAA